MPPLELEAANGRPTESLISEPVAPAQPYEAGSSVNLLESGTPPDDTPIAIDISCPSCKYNLRGLTSRRCPECGQIFDLSALLAIEAEKKAHSSRLHSVAAGFGAVIATIVILATIPYSIGLFVLFAPVGSLVFESALVAAMEFVIVGHFVTGLARRPYRAWWEGVILCQGANAMVAMMFGYGIAIFAGGMSAGMIREFWPLMLLTSSLDVGVQYSVMRSRGRAWKFEANRRPLLLVCAAAKLMTALLFLIVPIRIMRF